VKGSGKTKGKESIEMNDVGRDDAVEIILGIQPEDFEKARRFSVEARRARSEREAHKEIIEEESLLMSLRNGIRQILLCVPDDLAKLKDRLLGIESVVSDALGNAPIVRYRQSLYTKVKDRMQKQGLSQTLLHHPPVHRLLHAILLLQKLREENTEASFPACLFGRQASQVTRTFSGFVLMIREEMESLQLNWKDVVEPSLTEVIHAWSKTSVADGFDEDRPSSTYSLFFHPDLSSTSLPAVRYVCWQNLNILRRISSLCEYAKAEKALLFVNGAITHIEEALTALQGPNAESAISR